MPELAKSRNNALIQSVDYMDYKNNSNQVSIDSMMNKSELLGQGRRPRKILMPHIVNRAQFDNNSIAELYKKENDITNIDDVELKERFRKGKLQFVNTKYNQQKMDSVTSRLSKTQMSKIEYKSSITPRGASHLTNYTTKLPLKATIERKAIGGGRMN